MVTDVTTHTKCEKRIKFHYRVDNEILRTLSQLSLTNPLEVAWELVPFSFVVDWMLPIGDYLSNMSALHGIEPLGYSVGDKIVVKKNSGSARYSASSDPTNLGHCEQDNRAPLHTWVRRRTFSGGPPNSFPTRMTFPFTEVASIRFGNAVALLSQQLSRLTR